MGHAKILLLIPLLVTSGRGILSPCHPVLSKSCGRFIRPAPKSGRLPPAWLIKKVRGGWASSTSDDGTGEAAGTNEVADGQPSDPLDPATAADEGPIGSEAAAEPPQTIAESSHAQQSEPPRSSSGGGGGGRLVPGTRRPSQQPRRAEEEGGSSAASASSHGRDPYNARLPWLITNRMRRILIEELHYLPEEVDAMSARVATVVVNKRLERPSKGMPAAFRKDYQLGPVDKLKGKLSRAVATVKKRPLATLAGLVGMATVGVGSYWLVSHRDEPLLWWWQEEEEEEEEEEELPWWREWVVRLRERIFVK